jgi:FkbM family methyltransferase
VPPEAKSIEAEVKFSSKAGQDQFLLQNFFRGRRKGVFVDVGAYDGTKHSNSLFFERDMAWNGLCVEPLPSAYAGLKVARRSINEQVCVADFEGEADFIEAETDSEERLLSGLADRFDPRHIERLDRANAVRTVRRLAVTRLDTLLERHNLFAIDYCSISTHGAELSILQDLDLERFRVSVFTIANEYNDPRLIELMRSKGYVFVTTIDHDQVFRRADFPNLPLTSVLCAVWHQDAQRAERLRGHAANLAAQSVPVEPIYVFDGSDTPPDWLPGRKIVAHESLTIYQAWNLGLALVSTPFVMNLNLDDRLAPDAIATLQFILNRDSATMVGGDWKICYSQAEADAVESCYSAGRLPFAPQWPPTAGTTTRLGSGTGSRGTYGPAVMWRLDAHIGAPRYTWRLPEGTALKVAGDTAWWTVVTEHLKKKAVRFPGVIGNYHSHPSTQAEFRHDVDELALMTQLGLSLL